MDGVLGVRAVEEWWDEWERLEVRQLLDVRDGVTFRSLAREILSLGTSLQRPWKTGTVARSRSRDAPWRDVLRAAVGDSGMRP